MARVILCSFRSSFRYEIFFKFTVDVHVRGSSAAGTYKDKKKKCSLLSLLAHIL